MVYPRNPYSTPNVSFFGGSGGSSKANGASVKFDPAPHPGLINLGNTCFLNSVLQAMGGTRQFKQLLQGPAEELQDRFGQPFDSNNDVQFDWTRRAQSPALRVRDEEHGKLPPHHQATINHSTMERGSLVDGAATMNPKRETVDSAAFAPHEPTVIDLPLNTALRHTLEKIWGSSNNLRGPSINPKRLVTLLGAKYDQYLEYGQQDSHELMRHLLDACRMEEMDLIKKMQPLKPSKKARSPQQAMTTQSAVDGCGGGGGDVPELVLQLGDVDRGEAIAAPMSVDEADQLAVVAGEGQQPDPNSDVTTAQAALSAASTPEEALLPFLDMLFCGRLASMIVCESCKKVSHTYEDFFDLSLSIRGEVDTKVKKRDRIRSMADRWRRATQGKAIEKSKLHDSTGAASTTPIATPVFSETETSDVEGKKPQKKRTSFLSTGEESKTRFSLRTRSITRRPTTTTRAEKLGATSGSEMEPDFPDVASLALAPSTRARQLVVDSAPPSAGEEDGDARTHTRLPRMLAPHENGGGGGGESSREPSPAPPANGRAPPPALNGVGGAAPAAATMSSHQAAYIDRILAEDAVPAPALHGLPRRPATASESLSDVVSQASAANGRPFQGLHRGFTTRGPRTSALSEFETDPGSPSAKRRKQIQEEQKSTGLIAALRQFTSVEVLDGDNSFACKNCWRLQNPPSARERERYRRRKERRGLRPGSDDESEPSSSEGGSESGDEGQDINGSTRINGPRTPTVSRQAFVEHGGEETRSGETTATELAPRRFNASIPTITTHAGTPPAIEPSEMKQLGLKGQPGQTPNKLAAPQWDEHGYRPPDSPMATSSYASDSNLSAGASGYDTGTETDQSGAATSLDSETGLDDESDAEGEARLPGAPAKPKGPKRSTQSLPRRALKRYLIASAPPVLVFHLKRFQATGRGFVSGLAGLKKIDDQVSFPEYLDVTPWLAPPREEYDRKGRLKGNSDPLVLRKRAEEEARRAGMDVKDVQVQVESHEAMRRRGRHRHGHGHGRREGAVAGDKGLAGKRHSMWSWTAKNRCYSPGPSGAGDAFIEEAEEVQEGPRVKQGDREILPSVVSRPKTQYRLYAVIVHQGSLSAGHYTAYVLSDKVRLSSEEKAALALTATVTRSAPASRANTPATPVEPRRERRRSTQLAEAPSLQPLSEAGAGEVKDETAAAVPPPPTTSAGDISVLSSSGSSSKSSSSGVANPAVALAVTPGGAPPLLQPKPQPATMQADFLRPQTSISSMGLLDSEASIHSGLDAHQPSAASETSSNGNGRGSGAAAATTNSSAESLKAKATEARPPSSASASAAAARASNNSRAVAKPDEGGAPSADDGRRWVYTSDTVVWAATIDEVLKAKAYMLFYERV